MTTYTPKDSSVLGKFNADTEHRCTDSECIYLGQPTTRGCECHKPREQMITEELKAANNRIAALAKRIKMLEADLLECREYLEGHVDVIDGSYGEQRPNKAMQLTIMIDKSLHGPGNF